MFRDDLCAALRQWRAIGDRIILLMDANDKVFDGLLSKELMADGIELREAVHSVKPGPGPKTHFRGTDSIDGIWHTPDLELCSASYLPFDSDMGDHRPVLADFTQASVLGVRLPHVAHPAARRLNSKIERIRSKYIKDLEEKFRRYQILERLQKIAADAAFPASREAVEALEKIDKEMTKLMLRAEKGCRKLYAQHYDFSPQVKRWLDRCHAYRALIRLQNEMKDKGTRDPKKLNKNVANIYRSAFRCGIEDARALELPELHVRYAQCREHAKGFMVESKAFRKAFLTEKMKEYMDNNKTTEATRIRNMLRGEANKKEWQVIKSVTKPNSAGAVPYVEVKKPDGSIERIEEKEEMEEVIGDDIISRSKRANGAPICQGALRDLLGYGISTQTALDILHDNSTPPPPGTDKATCTLLKEIAHIWKEMETGNVDIVVTRDDFQHYWKRAKERTSSAYSGRHFGHYKAAAYSDALSEVHALHTSLISQTGSAPESWARGLSVMLEKIAGVALVTKLRAILLMEADFNFHNKLIFGTRMLNLARKHGLVQDEIYSEKGRTAEDGIMHQVLAYDIARQKRASLIVAYVDAAQCYDRIAHAFAALTLRANKAPESSVHCMLQPIRDMKFYIRTAHGKLKGYAGDREVPKQGKCQGNGAALATWQQISTVMLRAHRRQGHGVTVRSPISGKTCTQAGLLYVDDTNLWAGMDPDADLAEVADEAQRSIDCWGKLLIGTGGALKPEKCKWTVHDMVPRADGTWEYRRCKPADSTIKEGEVVPGTVLFDADHEEDHLDPIDHHRMTVPQADGDAVAIEQLQSCQAVENLGLLTPPEGSSEPQLCALRARTDEWINNVRNGGLPTRSTWMSYNCKLWSGLKYGIGASPAKLEELANEVRRKKNDKVETGLGTRDHKILSMLGICRNINTPLRYIPACFGGMGLKSLTVEATTASLNLFLQHYGTDTSLGQYLTFSIENLQLELGVAGCPFSYDYGIWNGLATDSWVKSLWERIHTFGLSVEIDYETQKAPRENDECIMECQVREGVRGAELASINRARKQQEALFWSDIATANGKKIDPIYLADWEMSFEGQLGRHRSVFEYGRERPTDHDWVVWEKALKRLNLGYCSFPIPLGKWVAKSPRIWRVFYDRDQNCVEVLSDEEGLIRCDHDRGRTFRRGASTGQAEPSGLPATVEATGEDMLKLFCTSETQLHVHEEETQSFLERLKSWGGEWMWEGLHLNDDEDISRRGGRSREQVYRVCDRWLLYEGRRT